MSGSAASSRKSVLRASGGPNGTLKDNAGVAAAPISQRRALSADLLGAILQEIGHGVILIDDKRRLLYSNPCADDLLGIRSGDRSVEDVLARNVVLRSDGSTPLQATEPVLLKASKGEPVDDFEICWRNRSSSERRWLNLSSRPLAGPDSNDVRTLLVFNRLDRRKQYEAELILARDEALEAAQVKAELLANICHQIRTPLTSIVGMTETLLDTGLTGEQREFAATVAESAHSLIAVVNEVCDFSSISAANLETEKSEFRPVELVESVLDVFAEHAHSKGIELASYVEREVPKLAIGEPERLRQVLTNLLRNAIKFTARGDILLSLRCEGEQSDEAVLHFTVRDSGIGISPAVREKLVRVFSQGERSLSAKAGGSGLGLAISAKIVEATGGEIGVESLAGEGSSFWFTAPVATQPPMPAIDADPHPDFPGVRVLIIDDNLTSSRVVREYLTSWGVVANVVRDGASALAALREGAQVGSPFSAALVQSSLPDTEAVALCREIQKDPAISQVRLIVTYPLGRQPDRILMREAGIQTWLAKPIRQSQLHASLTTSLAAQPSNEGNFLPRTPIVASESAARSADRAPQVPHSDARILLAEDHAVNQRVMMRMLSRLGYQADAVANGLEAIAALQRTPYRIVLMDCQMMELDGYEATRRIRSQDAPLADVTIIGVTANALDGDRQKCLDAGMNDYMSKPILARALAAMLEKWLAKDAAALVAESPAAIQDAQPQRAGQGLARTAHGAPKFPIAAAATEAQKMPDDHISLNALDVLKSMDPGDDLFLAKLIDLFLADMKERVDTMAAAVDQGDGEVMKRTAHALKGACGHFGADRLAELCRKMEAVGQSGAVKEAPGLYRELAAEGGRVRDDLEKAKTAES